MRVDPLALLLALAACSEPSSTASGGGGRAPENWALSAEPLAVIGNAGAAEAAQLSSVRGAVLLSRDRIVVADGASSELRFFSIDGTHVASVGRKGDGRGEFRSINGIGHGPRGGVCIWDARPGRVTCLDGEGGVLREYYPALDALERAAIEFVGSFSDGSVLFASRITTMELRHHPSGERRDSVHFIKYTAEGGAEIIAAGPGRETYLHHGDRVWENAWVLFGRSTFADVDGNRFALGVNDSIDLELRDSAGDVLWDDVSSVRLDDVDRRMLASMKQQLVDSITLRYVRARYRIPPHDVARIVRVREEFVSNTPARRTIPAFRDMKVDHDGRIWTGAYPLEDEPSRFWTVHEEEGVVATVELPPGAEVLDIGSDVILLKLHDDLDVEAVVAYRIQRSRP